MTPRLLLKKDSTNQFPFLSFLLYSSVILSFSFSAGAQTTYSGVTFDLVVSGTSTLHDWDMKSAKGICTAVFTFNNSGHLSGLTALNFSTPATALKSAHTSMDDNAYKSLKTDKNPVITYVMNTGSVIPEADGAGTIKCTGKLTVAGATVNEDVVALFKLNAEGDITVTGSSKISMKDFNMTPPTFMMGTIKTGNDVVLKFNLTLRRS